MIKVHNEQGKIINIINKSVVTEITFNKGDTTPIIIKGTAYYDVYISTTLKAHPTKGLVKKEVIDND